MRKLTTPAENVVVQTPVYNIFFNSIYNNGRNILESPLKYDGEGYAMDFEDLEAKLADPQTSLMILCRILRGRSGIRRHLPMWESYAQSMV